MYQQVFPLITSQTRALRYTPAYLIPMSVVFGATLGGLWAWCTPVFVFVIIPILEMMAGSNSRNLPAEEEERIKRQPLFSWILWSYIPIQVGLTLYVLWSLSTLELATYEQLGLVLSLGISNGGIGITVAHELVHRSSRVEQWLGRTLLMTTWYMHFAIEHVRGHHVHVATPQDPASAPLHTSFYSFWVRTVPAQWQSAWHIEAKRLKKHGRQVLSFQNEMLWFLLIQTGFTTFIGLWLGPFAVFGFLGSCLIAFSLLEAVNYLEHYGLERNVEANGKPERVSPEHSWNSDHLVSRMFLFELSRHSDHHATASRKYQVLRSFEESPHLPTGYPGMVVLALLPPLWFRVMDPLVEKYRKTERQLTL
jgi:alkane 1-monooxygenase